MRDLFLGVGFGIINTSGKGRCTMETLLLIRPAFAHAAEIAGYRQECLDAGSRMDGCGPLRRMEDPLEWINYCKAWEGEHQPDGSDWVRATQFLYIRPTDGKMVGTIQVRHTFNAFLAAYGGNIGYSVRPSERRKGYATRMLRDTLPFCRQIGLDRVLISCRPDNIGSRKTILANGGVYESTVWVPERQEALERYWIDLTIPQKSEKCD